MSAYLEETLRRPPVAALLAGIALLLAVVAYPLGAQIAREDYRALLVSAVVAQTVWVFVKWRTSVFAFMVYVVVEGFLLNYFHTIPELNLLKDLWTVAMFGGLAWILAARGVGSPFPMTSWMVPFLAFAVVYVMQVFNPALPNLLVGLVGVRTTLLFFLLMPVGYWFFESRRRVLDFFWFMVWLSVPVALFGLVQYWMGPAWLTSLSPGFNRAITFAIGDGRGSSPLMYFRTLSTFVHTGGFGQYLSFMMLIVVALWCMPSMRPRRLVLAGMFTVLCTALLTTGSRGSLVAFALAACLLLVLHRRVTRLVPLLLVLPLLLWASIFVADAAFVERFETILDLDYVARRNMPLFFGGLDDAMRGSDWAGMGAGYASVAARHVGPTPMNVGVLENGLAKIRWEAGLPGLVLYAVFISAMMLDSLRVPARIPDRELRWLVTACGLFLFTCLLSVSLGTPFDASPSNTYIWFFAGFLARSPQLADPAPQAVRT
jgi:hypothetical protein